MSYIDLTKTAIPSTPAADHVVIYVDTADKILKTKDDAGLVRPCAPIIARLSSDVTTTSSTLSNIAGLSFPVISGETWTFEAELAVTGVTDGTFYGVDGPTASAVLMNVWGNTSAVGTYSYNRVTAMATASTVAMATSNGTALYIRLTGSFVATSSATFTLQFKSVTNGNTSTVKAGSFLRATRVS